MAYPKLFTLLIFSIAFCIFHLPQAAAEELGQRSATSGNAVTEAYDYSFEILEKNDDMPGIGVVIAYGTGNAVTPQDVGRAFVAELKRRGYKARYFYYEADWPGMTIEYRIGYSVLGPWDADTAAGKMSTATEHADAARRVHKSVKGEAGIGF